MNWRNKTIVVAGALTLALVAAACGNPDKRDNGPQTATGMIANLNGGGFGGGDNPQQNYNPYAQNRLTVDYTFEPLLMVNNFSCDVEPWLGTDYTWNSPKQLTVHTRQGVKFSDGQPFSAKDVEFSFNLLKKVSAFDPKGVWSALSKVAATDDHTVVFDFTRPASDQLDNVGGTLIVPEHIWKDVKDPQTYVNKDGIGTGPFTYKSFNGQTLVLQRNPNYWQADKVRVQQLTFHGNGGGGDADKLRMARGDYDFNSIFISDIDKTYVSKDPNYNKYWFPPSGIISLYLNLTKAPFNDVKFRQALTYAINKDEIAKKAEFGYVKTASQTGLLLPGQQDWLSPKYSDGVVVPFDQGKAKSMLTAAGYQYSGDKLVGKDGKPVHFVFQVPTGFLDWIQAANLIKGDLDQIGIDMDVRTGNVVDVESNRAIGNFDAVFGVHGTTCTMYINFDDPLGSNRTKPIGQKADANFVRWQDPATDQALGELRAATDENAQKTAVAKLQDVFVQQVPVIPLWYGPTWFQYRTKNAAGWPSTENSYAAPNNTLIIITKLTPPSK